jgi:hypothetical protein
MLYHANFKVRKHKELATYNFTNIFFSYDKNIKITKEIAFELKKELLDRGFNFVNSRIDSDFDLEIDIKREGIDSDFIKELIDIFHDDSSKYDDENIIISISMSKQNRGVVLLSSSIEVDRKSLRKNGYKPYVEKLLKLIFLNKQKVQDQTDW